MNKIFNYSSRLRPAVDYVDGSVIDAPSDVVDPNRQLLDYIFTVDPVTGMSVGDIAFYTNENANPEIKRFIEMNLLKENPNIDSVIDLPDDISNKYRGVITDDDIANFSRNHGESSEDYAVRMRSYFDAERSKRAAKREMERVKSIIDAANNN